MVRTLESGTSLMLFPEGTRSRSGLLPFRLGAFRAAAKTSHPVVPVSIDGTPRMLPRDFRLPESAPLSVQVLAPICGNASVAGCATHLRDLAQAAIVGALGESQHGPRQSHRHDLGEHG